ncbi:HNH endonuclease [Paenibacillus sp. MMS20-IR301]|uniref:HNH endonuclease n=1 Tax=Paenibacillus sp. MMS20-IR301 TaxID=2895946 RepID=UPI0028F03B57|nr:HNH endonuclease [Paenibacillus sp. MMS20-IR301]WNS41808.1 HNH endonuclease [Paenibacillus sp. MMS20-IR301]
MTETISPLSKQCAYCHQTKPVSEFRRRTGRRSKGMSRRGACRECRKLRGSEAAGNTRQPDREDIQLPGRPQNAGLPAREQSAPPLSAPAAEAGAGTPRAARVRQPKQAKEAGAAAPGLKGKARARAAEPARRAAQQRGPKPDPQDASALIPSAGGMILMRGHSDKGRRWHQEIDHELAVTLVREHAAVVVNRRTIRRLYSNKDFRTYILTRDNYTCCFCGLYGDTIDHLLPRAKGGHTTPDNCVCACNLCNQTKADQYVAEFMGR